MTENEIEQTINDEVDPDVEIYEGEPDNTPREVDGLQDDGRETDLLADDLGAGAPLGGEVGKTDPSDLGGDLGAVQEAPDA